MYLVYSECLGARKNLLQMNALNDFNKK